MLPTVVVFLHVLALEARADPHVRSSQSAEQLWARINALPWPYPGAPVAQPDV